MKKIILLTFTCLFFNSLQANASLGWGYKYRDAGAIYAGTTIPQSVSRQTTSQRPNLNNLKSGESSARNILQLIEIGNASIDSAAKNGGITKIHYVDTQINKVYIPLVFLPIYTKEIKTIVYGE